MKGCLNNWESDSMTDIYSETEVSEIWSPLWISGWIFESPSAVCMYACMHDSWLMILIFESLIEDQNESDDCSHYEYIQNIQLALAT